MFSPLVTKLRAAVMATLLVAGGSLLGGGAFAGATGAGPGAPVPAGYNLSLVYLANGVFNPTDSNYTPPTGDYFLHTIMGFNDQQIAAWRASLTTFFQNRFGLDFSQGDTSNNVTINGHFMFDPRNNYRAYTISGLSVPSTGYVVRDGGWSISVGPGGTVLHGTYGGATGRAVPAGSAFAYGFYNIQVEPTSDTASGGASAQPAPAPIILHYQSHTPILPPDVSGNMSFQCELVGISPAVGDGLAQGFIGAPLQNPDGTIKVDIRNVLTFSTLAGF
jgi:hypothetical protein